MCHLAETEPRVKEQPADVIYRSISRKVPARQIALGELSISAADVSQLGGWHIAFNLYPVVQMDIVTGIAPGQAEVPQGRSFITVAYVLKSSDAYHCHLVRSPDAHDLSMRIGFV